MPSSQHKLVQTRENAPFHIDPAFVLGVAPARSERVRLTGVRLLYRPTRILTLDFGWRTERRSSAIAFGNYDVGIASVGARVTF
jgi:hypothetical protein